MGQQSIHNMEPIQVCSYPTCPILPAPILFYLILPAILPALSFQALKAAEETLQLLCSWLPRHYPDRFAYESRIISNHTTGESFDTSDPAINPLYVASLLVQVSAYQILQLSLCMWPAFSCKWVHIRSCNWPSVCGQPSCASECISDPAIDPLYVASLLVQVSAYKSR
jgi:hypothetical protein